MADNEYPGICCQRHAPPDLVARYHRAIHHCSRCKRTVGPPPPFFIPPATYEQPCRYTAEDGSRVHGEFDVPPGRHPVYHIVYRGLHQPHHRLFIETDSESGGGTYFEVTGAIEQGVQYKETHGEKPELAHGHEALCSKIVVGSVAPADLMRFRELYGKNTPKSRKRIDMISRRARHPRSQFWANHLIKRSVAAGVLKLVER